MILETTIMSLAPLVAAVTIDIDGTLLVQMAAFLISIFMLHFLIYRPYLKTLEARSESVEGSEEEADEMTEQAEVLQAKYEQRIRKARRDAQEVRDSLRNQGLAEQQDIEQEVREELDQKLSDERAVIAKRVETAREEIEERADGLADAMVERLIPEHR